MVKDWHLGPANQVERVLYADGTVLTHAQVNTAAGQPAGAKAAIVEDTSQRESVEMAAERVVLRSTMEISAVTRQVDALLAAMASFSGSAGMPTHAMLPSYTLEHRHLIAAPAR